MEFKTYILGAVAFVAGALSKKILDFIADRLLGRIGGIKLLGNISFEYDLSQATFKYYSDEGWLDVPFDIEFTLYNKRKSVRTLHAPKIRFHLPLEVRNDMGLITGQMTYLTTIFDYPVSLDPDKHEKVNLRGWASFFENEKDENACKAKLMNVAMNVLRNFMSSTLYFKDARSKRELFFGSDLRYLIYDGVRPVDTSNGML